MAYPRLGPPLFIQTRPEFLWLYCDRETLLPSSWWHRHWLSLWFFPATLACRGLCSRWGFWDNTKMQNETGMFNSPWSLQWQLIASANLGESSKPMAGAFGGAAEVACPLLKGCPEIKGWWVAGVLFLALLESAALSYWVATTTT